MLRTDDSNSKFKEELLLKKFCLDILSDQNQNVRTNINFGRKMSIVQPLFQALMLVGIVPYVYSVYFCLFTLFALFHQSMKSQKLKWL